MLSISTICSLVALGVLTTLPLADGVTCFYGESSDTGTTCTGNYCLKTVASADVAVFGCSPITVGTTCPSLSQGNIGFCTCDSGDYCAGRGNGASQIAYGHVGLIMIMTAILPQLLFQL